MSKVNEILGELKRVVTGNTIDAMIIPVVFVLVNRISGLRAGIIGTMMVVILLSLYRLRKKEKFLYVLIGTFGFIAAAILTTVSGDEVNFFIPDIIGNAVIILLIVISLVIKKPAAAIMSHITRGYKIDWYFRNDIRPAYTEVTVLWAVYFVIRLLIMLVSYLQANVWLLAGLNVVLGAPAFIIILIISYIYGNWRLNQLDGPSIDEFIEGKEPPWTGQKKGF